MTDKILILDLDETLIHATSTPLLIQEDFLFEHYFVYKRPYLDRFLIDISKHYKLGIWSSADDDYVEHIVDKIRPNNVDFEIIWGNSKCSYKRDMELDTYIYEKRLDKLRKKGFDLKKIIIIDDSPEKARANYGNAVYINEFNGEQQDQELLLLYDYLVSIKKIDNVRTLEKRYWRKK